MIRRRHASNPLEPTDELRWYTVRSMHGALLEARALPRGSDLKRAFVCAMLEWLDAGWQLGEFSSVSGTFFCTRGPERRMVGISPGDPQCEHRYGAAHLMGCPSCEE
jgi:hypothetical protein